MNRIETNVAPRHTLEIPFVAFTVGALVYRIVAEEPIDSFVVDPLARDAYRSSRPYVTVAVTEHERMHTGQALLPYGGQWFVIVRNPTDKQVRVQAELEFLPSSQASGMSGSYGGIFGSR